jgi:hypothetical protein
MNGFKSLLINPPWELKSVDTSSINLLGDFPEVFLHMFPATKAQHLTAQVLQKKTAPPYSLIKYYVRVKFNHPWSKPEVFIQSAPEIVKHFKILITCFSARVSRSAVI